MSLLSCIEVEPKNKANSTVIWLHGLGASGHDFEAVIPELNLPANNRIRFIFPHAPAIPVTINSGFIMPAWYDILEITFERKIDEKQLKQSANAVHALIDREVARGIDSKKIIIAGFSQGGAVGIHAGLTYPKRIAGVLAMSTYFATAKSIKINPANQNLPIQLFHGIYDAVVPEAHGAESVKALLNLGFNPCYETFSMEHSICAEEITATSEWIQKLII